MQLNLVTLRYRITVYVGTPCLTAKHVLEPYKLNVIDDCSDSFCGIETVLCIPGTVCISAYKYTCEILYKIACIHAILMVLIKLSLSAHALSPTH